MGALENLAKKFATFRERQDSLPVVRSNERSMRLHIPFIPFTFVFTIERRPSRRLTIVILMALIAVLAVGFRIVRLSERSANDWAMDRQEVEKHVHEASFHSRMLNDILAYQSDHPAESSRIWVIHGQSYRVGPDLELYLEAMIAYHQRCAKRHEAAIGRWWDNITPEPPPEPPPRAPIEETAGRATQAAAGQKESSP